MFVDWYYRYEHRIGFGAMVAGFAFDWFTLWRIDLIEEHILIICYLVAVIMITVYLSLVEEHKKNGGWWKKLYTAGLFILQFALGGLFGRFLLFYTISGAISGSWPFLLLLFTLLIANELSRHHYQKYVLRMSAFAVALLSYSILLLPVVLSRMSDGIFILSVVISLVTFGLINRSIMRLFPSFKEKRVSLLGVVAGIYSVVVIFYFNNLIPPVPLSMKDSGIYHNISKQGGEYLLTGEDYSWFEEVWPGQTLHIISGERLYYFSSVFAPTKLTTQITHEWQRYDDTKGKWVLEGSVRFPVIGGADGGYRGYSEITNVMPGHYRVNVRTDNGALIGRKTFDVITTTARPVLVTTSH